MRRRAPVAFALVFVLTAAALAADGGVRVTPLIAEGNVFASFAADDAYTPEVREAVRSGLATTLTYYVELRQPSMFWFDRTLAAVTVAATIKYDPLTGGFQVSKTADNKVFWADRTTTENDTRKWATAFERVRLSSGTALEPNGEYYVRVRVRTAPRRTFFFWPWGRDDGSGRAEFTFIR